MMKVIYIQTSRLTDQDISIDCAAISIVSIFLIVRMSDFTDDLLIGYQSDL